MDIAAYVAELARLVGTGQTTEHSFRPALATLFDSITPDVSCINEPEAIRNVGRPDFVLLREAGARTPITVGHVEAKDIDLDINPRSLKDANKKQHERYTKALPNLIYTNGLDFDFYKHGEKVRSISIGEWLMGVQPKPENFEALANQLKDFAAERLQTITSAEKLAELMAGKAVLIKDVLANTLRQDTDLTSELAGQFQAFRDQLIHDLEQDAFADIYAETIAYGMFAARLHDETIETFSRAEALEKLPKSNPFLRKLFEFVAGPSLPGGIAKTVDELAEIFQASDPQKLFENFGNYTQRNDPFIHFYETFLAKYNPAKRKARGVWYTPEPVVNFIVRAVDDVLKSEFGLSQGLADTSKITVDWDTGQLDRKGKPITIKKDVHRVQILDPAAGTGTFLAEVIRQIGERVQGVAPGQWSSYVENDLIPRLHGFELLMASYAMCHMKLDMMLTAMDYKPTAKAPRLGVYLTNSLEEGERVNQTLPFAQWLSNEAKEANTVKNDVPVMCVIGNPPYSGISQNNGDWITKLLEAYKREPGSEQKLQERKHWLNDDYVKFIRFAEHMIAKNGEGVLGFITNHSYLDNPTFRGMRWHLLDTFDKIWVLDLHGNAKKKEVSPDGSPDKNVFDIQQGVALIIAVKKKTKGRKDLATVWHGDLWGSRKEKYDELLEHNGGTLIANSIQNRPPKYLFNPQDSETALRYQSGFSILEMCLNNSVGFVTGRDIVNISYSHSESVEKIEFLRHGEDQQIRARFGLKSKDARDWKVSTAKADAVANPEKSPIRVNYRPFDSRFTVYTGNSRGLYASPQSRIQSHFTGRENLGLVVGRQGQVVGSMQWNLISISKAPTDFNYFYRGGGNIFPLYLYPAEGELDQSIRVNMDPVIRRRIEAAAMGRDPNLPLEGRSEKQGAAAADPGGGENRDGGKNTPTRSAPASPDQSRASPQGGGGEVDITPQYADDGRPNEVAIFDYIYGVLHCPAYRETYKEYLKIDFPRIPYPPSPDVFRDVQEKGTQLRRLHLMEDAVIGETPYPFTGDGDSVVGKVKYEGGAVFINDTQCFENVPEIAWNFYIGGYQPAQKWLKDRKGRTLSFDDILHYQKIIKILSETHRIMQNITLPLGEDQ